MPPEEEAVASKACGNKYKYCKKIVCRCPKQQKTTQRDQGEINGTTLMMMIVPSISRKNSLELKVTSLFHKETGEIRKSQLYDYRGAFP